MFIKGVLNASWENALAHIKLLLNFLNRDHVIQYIFSLISKEIKITSIDADVWIEQSIKPRTLGSKTEISFPESVPERFQLLKEILEGIANKTHEIEKFFVMYADNGFASNWNCFKYDFIYPLYADIKSLLIDLRVDAELNGNKKVSKQVIVNYIVNGNVQNIQADTISKTDITQNK